MLAQYMATVPVGRPASHPEMLGIAFVLLLYWISHAWVTARRGGMTDDPLIFAIKDRVSQVLVILMGIAAWLAV